VTDKESPSPTEAAVAEKLLGLARESLSTAEAEVAEKLILRARESLSPAEAAVAETLLRETREELTRSDGKSSLLLAAVGVGLSAILGAMLAGDWSPFTLPSPWEAVWWAGAGFAGVALLALGLAIWPKLKHRSRATVAVTYFRDAAKSKTPVELAEALRAENTPAATRTLVQLHALSKRALRKYRWLQVALITLLLAIGCALTAVLGAELS
jgi:hypothetical protein